MDDDTLLNAKYVDNLGIEPKIVENDSIKVSLAGIIL